MQRELMRLLGLDTVRLNKMGTKGRADKRYTLTFADLVSSKYDPQEKLIQDYNDSIKYEAVEVEEDTFLGSSEVGDITNVPYLKEGILYWVAVEEDDPKFDSSYYFVGGGIVDRIHQMQINIKLKNKQAGKKLAWEYIVKKDLEIDLDDYISALRIVKGE